jgi:hypothetical protein
VADTNLYRYVRNNPLSAVDPSGYVSEIACAGGKTDCCVTGKPDLVRMGGLQCGFNADSYVKNRFWSGINDRTMAGAQEALGKLYSFVVQMVAPYEGMCNCGVSQTLIVRDCNMAYCKEIANYLKVKDLKSDTVYNEPGLNAKDPFDFAQGWFPKCCEKMPKITFLDAPGAKQYELGKIEFHTCFHSKGRQCKFKKCCVTWTWDFDFRKEVVKSRVIPGKTSCE